MTGFTLKARYVVLSDATGFWLAPNQGSTDDIAKAFYWDLSELSSVSRVVSAFDGVFPPPHTRVREVTVPVGVVEPAAPFRFSGYRNDVSWDDGRSLGRW